MFKFLLPATAALGLIAFTAQSQDTAFAEAPVTAAPAMGWSVHHEGALAKLAYGVANTDQLALMVSCQPGDVTAAVYGDMQPEGARLVRASLPQGVDPLSDGEAEENRISVRDAALRGLAQRGRMDVSGDAGVFQLTANEQERRVVADFLAYCSAGRV